MPQASASKLARSAFAIWCLALAIILIGRIVAPSDLGQNLDQSKTIAFTLDMVNNNQWILPRDSLGELTRKPPLVNWLGAPIVALGFHSELALKLPAVISGVSLSILTFFAARFLFRKLDTASDSKNPDLADRSIASCATPLAFLAAGAWLASPSAIKHIYFMRPDILFAALLVGSWLCAIILLSSNQPKHPKRLALLLWLLAAAAILTKGPLAILVPLYLVFHILIITPRGSRKAAIKQTRCQWGIPLMIVPPALWLLAAYQINPGHVRVALFGEELSSRAAAGGFSGILNSLIKIPGFFFERFLPWSLPAVLAILFKPSSQIRSHPLAPAVLWTLLVLITVSATGLVAGSYLMPAYPAAAILAVYALYRVIVSPQATRVKPAIISIAALILISASLITAREMTMSRGAKTNTGEHIKAFAQAASQYVGTDDVHFFELGDLPIASLMGRHQSEILNQYKYIRWSIQPTTREPDRIPLIISDPIVTHDPITGEPIGTTITISLYSIPQP